MTLDTVGQMFRGWRNRVEGLNDISIANFGGDIPYGIPCHNCSHVFRTANGSVLEILSAEEPIALVCGYNKDPSLAGYHGIEPCKIKVYPTTQDDRFPSFSCPIQEKIGEQVSPEILRGFSGCPSD